MSTELSEFYETLTAAILNLDGEGAASIAQQIIERGGNAVDVIRTVIKPAADEIGDKFQREEFFLPQLMLAGMALESAMNVLLQFIPAGEGEAKRSVLIGTVTGDIHTIGKNVVAMMLRTGGFEVYDVGVDVGAETFVSEAVARNVDIIAVSSLLTTTLPYQRDVIDELKARGLRERFKVLVGGGPATNSWAEEIGADGYGENAAEALVAARQVLGIGAAK